jgi:hypothetical protein
LGWATAQAPAAAPPCAVTFRLDGMQLARFDALMAKARKHGIRLSREELLLQALAAFVEGAPASQLEESGPDQYPFTRVNSGETPGSSPADPREAPGSNPTNSGARLASAGSVRARSVPAQIILYRCQGCGRAEVVTSQGRRAVSKSMLERIECDAVVQAPGLPNRSTILPSVRQAVLARDGHRCQIRACGSTQSLEVHHVRPRSQGGSNKPENIISLFAPCHQLLHEKGLASTLLRPTAELPSSAGIELPSAQPRSSK